MKLSISVHTPYSHGLLCQKEFISATSQFQGQRTRSHGLLHTRNLKGITLTCPFTVIGEIDFRTDNQWPENILEQPRQALPIDLDCNDDQWNPTQQAQCTRHDSCVWLWFFLLLSRFARLECLSTTDGTQLNCFVRSILSHRSRSPTQMRVYSHRMWNEYLNLIL